MVGGTHYKFFNQEEPLKVVNISPIITMMLGEAEGKQGRAFCAGAPVLHFLFGGDDNGGLAQCGSLDLLLHFPRPSSMPIFRPNSSFCSLLCVGIASTKYNTLHRNRVCKLQHTYVPHAYLYWRSIVVNL